MLENSHGDPVSIWAGEVTMRLWPVGMQVKGDESGGDHRLGKARDHLVYERTIYQIFHFIGKKRGQGRGECYFWAISVTALSSLRAMEREREREAVLHCSRR